MHRLLRALALLMLLLLEAAALAVLLRLGARRPFAIPVRDLRGWLHTTAPADALAAILRLAAIAATGWLLLSTLAYCVARAVRAPAAIRATTWATFPTVRRIVDAALAASIVAGSVTGSLAGSLVAPSIAHAASGPPSPSAAVRDGRAPLGTSAADVGLVPATTAVVFAGDDLWQIAARELARATERDIAQLDPARLADYWRALCDANRAALRSGDVNLIFPGEVLRLPPAPPAPPAPAPPAPPPPRAG